VRAYSLTGDPLAAEPCCIYQPKNWDPVREQTPKPSNKQRCRERWWGCKRNWNKERRRFVLKAATMGEPSDS